MPKPIMPDNEIVTTPEPFTDGRSFKDIMIMLTAGKVEKLSQDVNAAYFEISKLDNQLANLGIHFVELSSPVPQWSPVMQDALSKLGGEIANASPAAKITLTTKLKEFTDLSRNIYPQLDALMDSIDSFQTDYEKIRKLIAEIKGMVDKPELYNKVKFKEELDNKIKQLITLKNNYEAKQTPVIQMCERLYSDIKNTLGSVNIKSMNTLQDAPRPNQS